MGGESRRGEACRVKAGLMWKYSHKVDWVCIKNVDGGSAPTQTGVKVSQSKDSKPAMIFTSRNVKVFRTGCKTPLKFYSKKKVKIVFYLKTGTFCL